MPYTKEGVPYQLPGIASRMAAESVAHSAETQRQDILLFIQRRGEQGATDEEIRDGMGILMNSINPRRGELVKLGLVANSGEMRLTRQKRWATVWKAVANCPADPVLPKKEGLQRENARLRAENARLLLELKLVGMAIENRDREASTGIIRAALARHAERGE